MARRLIRYIGRHHVGLIALIMATTGTAYAASLPRNSVGTAQLKNGSVTSAKIKDRSLRRRDFAAAQLLVGPRGPQGAQGAQGPQGATGPQGPVGGPTQLVIRVGGALAPQALCEAGEVAVGGGAVASGGAFVTQSLPLPIQDGAVPVGWQAASETAANAPGLATAWVICAS